MTTEQTFKARPRYIRPPRDVAHCECCCDHPLQHAIREFLDTFDNAVPPLSARAVVNDLRDALTQWEDEA